MPKAKPDVVYIHRIELQETERDLLEAYVVGKTLKNLVEPVAAIGAVWVTYKVAKATHDIVDEEVAPLMSQLWNWVRGNPEGREPHDV